MHNACMRSQSHAGSQAPAVSSRGWLTLGGAGRLARDLECELGLPLDRQPLPAGALECLAELLAILGGRVGGREQADEVVA
jgi:hypothetical protein